LEKERVMQKSRLLMWWRQQRGWLLALIPAMVTIGTGSGQVLFTNFGPGQSYDTGFVYVVNSNVSCSLNTPDVQAVQFQPSDYAVLDDAQLALGIFSGTNLLSVYLETDAADQPGAIIEKMDVTGLQPVFPGSVIKATSLLHPLLVGGTKYWLVAATSAADTCAGWQRNSTGDNGTGTNFSHNLLNTSPTGPFTSQPTGLGRPAFQIDGEQAYNTLFLSFFFN
jgi:hypothetical protein